MSATAGNMIRQSPLESSISPAPDVQATLAGDSQRFNVLVERFFGMVYSIGLARLGDATLAQDLAQEVFLRAYLCLAQLQDPRQFASWITQMARNLAIDWQRRGHLGSRIAGMVPLEEAHEQVPDTRLQGAREMMESNEAVKTVRRALQDLAPDQREVVLLHFMEELTQEEIADQLGVHRSTVSRLLDRSLKRLRALLAPTFRETLPRLRAPSTAIQRTVLLVGAAAGMATAQKSALAAQAGLAAGAPMPYIGTVGSWLKSAAALLKTGGTLMATSKGITITAVAAVAIGGGAYMMSQRTESATAKPVAPAAAPAGSSSESLMPTASARQFRDWNEMAQDFINQHPDNAGFAKLFQALSATNPSAVGNQRQVMDAVIASGWSNATPQLEAFVRNQAVAIDAAVAAAQTSPFDMPPVGDSSTPVPNFLAAQTLFKLMLLSARMAEVADPNQAAQRALLTMQLAESFRGKNAFLISHLIGIASESLAAKTLASILRNPALQPATGEWVLSSLQALDKKRNSFGEGVRGEGRTLIATIRRAQNDPAFRQQMKLEPLLSQFKSPTELENEIDRVYRLIASNYDKPLTQRTQVDMGGLANLAVALPNFLEASTRSDTAFAYMRLCEALAALRANKPEIASAVIDPFTDKPIAVLADKVYSLGPDQKDQQGAVLYEPSKGTQSPGDLVFAR